MTNLVLRVRNSLNSSLVTVGMRSLAKAGSLRIQYGIDVTHLERERGGVGILN